MDEPKRVLLVFGVMNRGGAETLAMNIFRNIDRTKLVFDFAVHTTEHCDYDDEIIALGGKIYSFPQYNVINHVTYVHAWENFFRQHTEYKIIHAHMTGTASVFLPIAKKYGLYTVSHSHIAKSQSGIRQKIIDLYRLPLKRCSDFMFSCTEIAGEWMFGVKAAHSDRHRILKNGIDLARFTYHSEYRDEIRKEFSLGNNFVVINVARFHIQKNHSFLLDVFSALQKLQPASKLLLVGVGELENDIKDKALSLGVLQNVVLAGNRSDVNKILSAADVFCMTSFREGLPVSLVEAQASGLPVVASDTISDEIAMTDLVSFCSLNASPDEWAKMLLEKRFVPRTDRIKEIKAAGYDIKSTAEYLEAFYLEKYE